MFVHTTQPNVYCKSLPGMVEIWNGDCQSTKMSIPRLFHGIFGRASWRQLWRDGQSSPRACQWTTLPPHAVQKYCISVKSSSNYFSLSLFMSLCKSYMAYGVAAIHPCAVYWSCHGDHTYFSDKVKLQCSGNGWRHYQYIILRALQISWF